MTLLHVTATFPGMSLHDPVTHACYTCLLYMPAMNPINCVEDTDNLLIPFKSSISNMLAASICTPESGPRQSCIDIYCAIKEVYARMMEVILIEV